jgi:hypothetical protein
MQSMARRKNNSNVPSDTLARARAQVGLNQSTEPLTQDTVEETSVAQATVAKSEPVVARGQSTGQRLRESQKQRKSVVLDNETIKSMLLNPTKFPTVEDLKTDYAFVVKDLRNMFLLALALVVFMAGFATIIP